MNKFSVSKEGFLAYIENMLIGIHYKKWREYKNE